MRVCVCVCVSLGGQCVSFYLLPHVKSIVSHIFSTHIFLQLKGKTLEESPTNLQGPVKEFLPGGKTQVSINCKEIAIAITLTIIRRLLFQHDRQLLRFAQFKTSFHCCQWSKVTHQFQFDSGHVSWQPTRWQPAEEERDGGKIVFPDSFSREIQPEVSRGPITTMFGSYWEINPAMLLVT